MRSIARLFYPLLLIALIGALAAFAPAAAAGATAPASTPSPAVSASPSQDQAVATRAKAWYRMLEIGNIDRTALTKQADDAFTDDKIKAISAQIKPLGDPTSFTPIDRSTTGVFTVYRYRVAVTGGQLIFTFTLDPDGKVAGLFLAPATE